VSDAIDKTLAEIKELEKKRTAAFERLAALEGAPKIIDKNDQEALRANFEAISEGRAVVMDLGQKKRKLAANEIARSDQNRINQFQAQIASGLMVVVDDYERV
jgi:hypothetical protein